MIRCPVCNHNENLNPISTEEIVSNKQGGTRYEVESLKYLECGNCLTKFQPEPDYKELEVLYNTNYKKKIYFFQKISAKDTF